MRSHCEKEGVACLLIVEGSAQAPVCTDPREDWVRTPVSRTDLQARVSALRNRVYGRRTPVLDSTGTLHFDARSVTVSTAQTELMELFVARFGEVVYRNELEQRLAGRAPHPTRNSLDLHIMRLRRRLAGMGLSIRTAWGRGYVLEPAAGERAA
ncbi:winged helix-turn-helix domain-containing protein [Streptomyces sp. CAU 1734]|uniref:winged helix-turn-helix domain-containing protein n=1 Tax=Streptomyces sp. CAU 1734 TaxID=3140360 RepID=UPI0032618F67